MTLSQNIKAAQARNKKYNKSSTYKNKKAPALTVKFVKDIAKKEVHRQIEDKHIKLTQANNLLTSYTFNTALTTVSMIPYGAFQQGTGQGDRVGNMIRTKSCIFSFILRPKPYDATSNAIPIPQFVLMFFGKVKNSRPQQPISTDFQKIWQNGDSANGFYSTTSDLLQEVNRDWFTVYKMLKFKVGVSQAAGSGNQAATQFYSNNDFKYIIYKKINLTKYCPKLVKFNDITVQPTNDGLWMWAMCVNADGSVASSTIPMNMDYSINYTYEDA